ncbi:DNA-methyltransferase [Alkalihalobacillus sp. NPDC078783]
MEKELLGSLQLNRVYQQECLQGMALIPDKSVDMVLCDLPYGTTKNKWDSIIDLEKLWDQYNRIIKDNGAIVLTASQPFTSLLVTSNIKNFKYEWIWKKNNATGHLNAKRMPMKEHESVLVFYKKPSTYNAQGLIPYNKVTTRGHNGDNFGKSGTSNFQEYTNYPKTIQQFNYDKDKLHPTQKPLELFEYLIKTYTNEGDLVLDNCMGSGTTAVAALNTGRKYIGFETESKYIEVINQRIESVSNEYTDNLLLENMNPSSQE